MALWVAFGAPEARAAPPVIEPGRELDVLGLIAPFEDEGVIAEGVRIAGIRIRGDRVVFVLTRAGPPVESAQVQLRPLADTARGRSFRVELPEGASPPLMAAARALSRAIARNDDGRFFVPRPRPGEVAPAGVGAGGGGTARDPVVSLEDQDGDFDLWRTPGAVVAIGCWLLLIASLLWAALVTLRRGWALERRSMTLTRVVIVGLVFAAALIARRSVPFTPLHANDHAFEDLAVTLDLPDHGAEVQRFVATYGPAWLVAQRASAAVFGRHHDGVGRASTAWGALAVALSLLAAWGAGASSWAAVLGAMAVALAPVAVRVGHSESALVVGQLLVASGLLLGVRGGRVAAAGLVAVVFLLARGHVVGPGLAGAVGAMAWGLSGLRPGPAETRSRWAPALAWLLALGAVSALGLLWNLQSAAGQLADRAGATGALVPLPGNISAFSLWFDPEQAPWPLLPLSALGLIALVALGQPWRDPRALIRPGAFASGFALLLVVGLLVCASVSDGLRYQSTLAPALTVLAGFAPRVVCVAPRRARWPLRAVVWLLASGLLVTLIDPLPGLTRLDAQGQAYRELRRLLGARRGDLYMVVPDRTGPRGAVPQVPEGPWTAEGPNIHGVGRDTVTFECQAGLPLREPLWVWLPPACASGEGHAAAQVCARLERFIRPDVPGHAGFVRVLASRSPLGIPGEFLRFDTPIAPWRLAPGGCPRPAR